MFKKGMKWLKRVTETKKEDVKVEKIDAEFAVYAYDDNNLPELKDVYFDMETAKDYAKYLKTFFGNVVVLGVQTDRIIEML